MTQATKPKKPDQLTMFDVGDKAKRPYSTIGATGDKWSDIKGRIERLKSSELHAAPNDQARVQWQDGMDIDRARRLCEGGYWVCIWDTGDRTVERHELTISREEFYISLHTLGWRIRDMGLGHYSIYAP